MAGPAIVSLWRTAELPPAEPPELRDRAFLCGGLRLDQRHILTVRHIFNDCQTGQEVYVRLIAGKEGSAPARLLGCHARYDAALLQLTTPAPLDGPPAIETRATVAHHGKPAALHVIDPKNYGVASPPNYGIGNFDDGTGEYGLTPEDAHGHSGGIVVVEGRIIGLLSRRVERQPLCRAVALHLLWPWIVTCAPDLKAVQPPPPRDVVAGGLSPALLERVRERISKRLESPDLTNLARRWGTDPLAGFNPADPVPQLRDLFDDLRHATTECLPEWRRDRGQRQGGLDDIRAHCRFLVTELVRLLVDARAAEIEPGPTNLKDPQRLHVVARYAGVADAVYFSYTELAHLLELQPGDIASAQAVHVCDDIASNLGENERQDLLHRLWQRVMLGEASPGRIDAEAEGRLRSRIERHRTRKNDPTHYVLNAPGSRQALTATNWRGVADALGLGLVLHSDGTCPCLLLDDSDLIDTVREYLYLLETL